MFRHQQPFMSGSQPASIEVIRRQFSELAASAAALLDAGIELSATDRAWAERLAQIEQPPQLWDDVGLLRDLADAMPQLVWIANPHGDPIYYNARAAQYDGIKPLDDGRWQWAPVVHEEDLADTVHQWTAAVREKQNYEAVHRIRMSTGEFRWHVSRGFPRLDGDGRVTAWFGTATDVHDLKVAQELARTSNEQLEHALAAGQLGLWDYHVPTQTVHFSAGWFHMLGLKEGEMPGTVETWRALIHPDDAEPVQSLLRAHIEGRTPYYEAEHRLRHADGEYRWILTRGQIVERDANGKSVRLIGTHQDVTESHRVREELRQRALLIELSDDPIIARRLDGEVVLWNRGAEVLYGYSASEAIGQRTHDLLKTHHPGGLESVEARLEISHSYTAELVHTAKDGRQIVVLTRQRLFRTEAGETLILETNRDITPFRQAVEALKESEARFRTAVGAVGILWTNNASGEMEGEQPGWAELTGQRYEEYQGFGWATAVHPEDAGPTVAAWRQAVAERRTFEFEHRVRRRDGEWRWFTIRAVPVLESSGEIREWVGVHADVTDLRLAQEQLRQSEALYRQIAEGLPDIVFTCSGDGQVDYLNPRWYEQTGQLTGLDLSLCMLAAVQAEDREAWQLEWRHALAAGRLFEVDHRLMLKSGESQWFMTRAVPIFDHEGRIMRWFGTSTNIHDQKAMEEALERRVRERTAELEQANAEIEGVAYSLAHDLRAPIRSILGTSAILLDEASNVLSLEQKSLLQRQSYNGKRLAKLIDDLLAYMRLAGKPTKREEVDMSQAALEVWRDLGDSPCHLEVEPGLHAGGDASGLRIVLQNLLQNARKFSPEGGTVRFGRTPDGVFFVTDEGAGLDMEYADRIFRPFERLVRDDLVPGTGIGLAIVKRVIEQRHGGRVWVESTLGEGSTFFFTLG